jgi:hypothetical protein
LSDFEIIMTVLQTTADVRRERHPESARGTRTKQHDSKGCWLLQGVAMLLKAVAMLSQAVAMMMRALASCYDAFANCCVLFPLCWKLFPQCQKQLRAVSLLLEAGADCLRALKIC